MVQDPAEFEDTEAPDDFDGPSVQLVRQVPIGVVFARIIIVTGMSVCAALAIFLAVGGLWLPALAGVLGTIAFLFLMFFAERFAEPASRA